MRSCNLQDLICLELLRGAPKFRLHRSKMRHLHRLQSNARALDGLYALRVGVPRRVNLWVLRARPASLNPESTWTPPARGLRRTASWLMLRVSFPSGDKNQVRAFQAFAYAK